MSDRGHLEPARLDELLADRAVQGLSPEETAELDRLLDDAPDVDLDEMDRAAAALDLALSAPSGESALPPLLRQRLETQAVTWLAEQRGLSVVEETAMPSVVTTGGGWLRATPWLVAAATLLLAVAAWWPRPAVTPESLIARDAVVLPWAENERGVSGEVIWSERSQRGFMRFNGLSINDPGVEQYQLWIFDGTRDDRYPVDGGVFDVPAGGGPLTVPIDPKLAVDEATLFAITIEPPGGVVVSDRSRLILLAKAE